MIGGRVALMTALVGAVLYFGTQIGRIGTSTYLMLVALAVIVMITLLPRRRS